MIALEEIGVPFEPVLINKAKAENERAEYLELNPKGKVPTLVVDGLALTENPAIHVYLAREYPAAGLLPTDEKEWLEALSLMSWFAAGIHPVIGRCRFPMRFSEHPESYAGIRKLATEELTKLFEILERRLADRQWLLGDWTILDGYMSWLWDRATGSGMSDEPFPRCIENYAENGLRASVTRTLAREADAMTAIEAEIDGPSPFALPQV